MISFSCRLARPSFLLDAAFESDNEIIGLFGPSGAGKSTILRLIAGLDHPDSGKIVVSNEPIFDGKRRINVPAHRRGVGYVFQDGQLFPHLSVNKNLRYGEWFAGSRPKAADFDHVCELLGLGSLLDRKPATLSGGERQRVAIGRAVLSAPRLLLMDEPLASLDQGRKKEILPFIERLRDSIGLSIIYVSHAGEEVARLADKVIKLEAGKIIAVGRPQDVLAPTLANSDNRFDAVSFVSARLVRKDEDYGVTILEHQAGDIVVSSMSNIAPGSMTRVAIRPANVVLGLATREKSSVRTVLKGEVSKIDADEGPFALVKVRLTGGDELAAFITRLAVDDLGLKTGTPVFAEIKAATIDESALVTR